MTEPIVDAKAFTDMPLSAQALYLHLLIRADDGFVENPKQIQDRIGAADDDARLLADKWFTVPVDSGVIVINSLRIRNYISENVKSRQQNKPDSDILKISGNDTGNVSEKQENDSEKPILDLLEGVNQKKEKKERKEPKERKEKKETCVIDSNKVQSIENKGLQDSLYCNKYGGIYYAIKRLDIDDSVKTALLDFSEMRKKIKKPLTERALHLLMTNLKKLSTDANTQVAILEQSVIYDWQGVYPLKNDSGNVGPNGVRLAAVRDTSLDDIF